MTKKFIDEVNEEIQDERIITFWQKYKYAVIGGIALIIGGTGVNVGYDKYIDSQKINQAVVFEKFINGKDELLAELLDGNAGVRFITAVEQAKILSEKGQNQEASEILYNYSKSADSPEKDYAIMASVWVGVGTVDSVELLRRLESVKVAEYKALKLLTSVEVYLQQNKIDEANRVLQEIEGDLILDDEYRKIAKDLMMVTKQ